MSHQVNLIDLRSKSYWFNVMFSFFSCNFTMQVLPCDIHHRIKRLVCSTMAIFAGFTSYVVSVMKALSITYITGKNWISLLSDCKLNPYDELQFGLTKTPQLVLLALKEMKKKTGSRSRSLVKLESWSYQTRHDRRYLAHRYHLQQRIEHRQLL